MNSTTTTESENASIMPMRLNSGEGPKLSLIDVGNSWVLIEPESMFWAMVPKGADMAKVMEEEVCPTIGSIRRQCPRRWRSSASEERFSAVYFNPTGTCNANCQYCYLPNDLRAKPSHMSYPQIHLALSNLHEFFENYPGSVSRNADGKKTGHRLPRQRADASKGEHHEGGRGILGPLLIRCPNEWIPP